MTQFNIEIVSDNVCPWCYVGKNKLEKAIAAYKEKHGDGDTFSTTFMPFYLNPDSPKTGMLQLESMRRRPAHYPFTQVLVSDKFSRYR
jgi:predicted DsbA family dithiol-disulfide isomerase